jgi:predicted patatin/cPLA2 family phospholipase
MLLLQASSSLPFIAYTVPYRGRVYMDGGMSDSIPLRKSMSDGNRRNVLILTQPRGYRKKPEPLAKLARYRYPRLKGIRSALDTRHRKYNETLDFIDAEEKKGDIFIIRPDSTLSVSRVERDQKKLYDLYDKGYNDAESKYSDLLQFLR